MNAVITLIMTLFNLYLMVVILRMWLQLARADFYNPFSQFTVKATQPIVGPLRRFIPSIGKLDTATLAFALIISYVKVFTFWLIGMGSMPPLFDVLFIGVINLIYQVMWLIFWILVIRALLSWVSQGNNPIEMVMHQLTDPMLSPVRRIIPPMGGLDLSVLVFLLGMQFIINLYKGAFGIYIIG